jgi:pimeloyl-ACP methyl ester carboxylesterase
MVNRVVVQPLPESKISRLAGCLVHKWTAKILTIVVATAILYGAPAQAYDFAANAIKVTDSEGHPVVGITCDNLRSMPAEQKDFLKIELPAELADAQIRATLTNPDGSTQDSSGANNVGEVTSEPGVLKYYPPDEFNFDQVPGMNQVTHSSTREVHLNLAATKADGTALTVEPLHIRLARPSVVLVHGINNDSSIWFSKKNGMGNILSQNSFNIVRFDHGKNDLAMARQPATGALFFKGNGPVEYSAALLRDEIEKSLAKSRAAGIATRRVDVVAHSYGGVIVRWYLSTHDNNSTLMSRQWYVNSANIDPPDIKDANLYWLPKAFMEGSLPAQPANYQQTPDIRKVITVACPWRGVPLSNFLNEARGPATSPALDLSRARIARIKSVGWLIRFMSRNGLLTLQTETPAMEVTAVASPWLTHLNRRPFVDDVAYAALAGNDNTYVAGLDAYTALNRVLSAAWFPYLNLERRAQAGPNYSDGLMPIWTAMIPAASRVVFASHDSILWSPEATAFVLQSLSSAALPVGRELNPQWNSPVMFSLPGSTAPGAAMIKTWRFQDGAMSPLPQSDIYTLIGGVGRINPNALKEISSDSYTVTATTLTVKWDTVTESSGTVRIYQQRRDLQSGWSYLLLKQQQRDMSGPTQHHEVVVDGLTPNTTYYYEVESSIPNAPDEDIVRRSRRRRFKTTA